MYIYLVGISILQHAVAADSDDPYVVAAARARVQVAIWHYIL